MLWPVLWPVLRLSSRHPASSDGPLCPLAPPAEDGDDGGHVGWPAHTGMRRAWGRPRGPVKGEDGDPDLCPWHSFLVSRRGPGQASPSRSTERMFWKQEPPSRVPQCPCLHGLTCPHPTASVPMAVPSCPIQRASPRCRHPPPLLVRHVGPSQMALLALCRDRWSRREGAPWGATAWHVPGGRRDPTGKRAGSDCACAPVGAVCSLGRGEALGSEEGLEASGAELAVARVEPAAERGAVGRRHRLAEITARGRR